MANNRMWLVNKRTGARLLLAKYYPSTRWSVFYSDLTDRISRFFRENELLPTQWGDNDYEVQYEMNKDLTPFDIKKHLDTPKVVAAYLEALLEEPCDIELLRYAVKEAIVALKKQEG